tara:strand:+ start:3180 stop:4043 length:864 start_codon:yes stop_codon:yes gene_type:complete
MNKYLIILAGSPRGGEKTYSSLYKYVKNHLNADLALCTTEDMYDESISLFQSPDYLWLLKDYDNFFDYFNENFDGSWKEYFELGKGTGLYESGSIHFIFKDFILKNYLNILENYDFIIYSRFDQYYLDFHINGDKNRILIPEGEDYYGICDRHAIIPKEYISKFLKICEYINLDKSLEVNTEYLNCETSFLNHLKHEGLLSFVERYPRTQFTSALSKDKTNWRIPIYKIYFFDKLMIKYPDEYIDSFKNLIRKTNIFKLIYLQNILFLNYLYLETRRFLGRLKGNIS